MAFLDNNITPQHVIERTLSSSSWTLGSLWEWEGMKRQGGKYPPFKIAGWIVLSIAVFILKLFFNTVSCVLQVTLANLKSLMITGLGKLL